MGKKQEPANILKELASKIKKEVRDAASKGTIQPEDEIYQCWKVDKFKYTEKGVETASRHIEYSSRKSWFRTSIKIQDSVKKSQAYFSALALLKKIQ
ncbi:unnamed protein product, partial [marine sediment metagenome]